MAFDDGQFECSTVHTTRIELVDTMCQWRGQTSQKKRKWTYTVVNIEEEDGPKGCWLRHGVVKRFGLPNDC